MLPFSGYVPKNKSVIACQSDSTWKPDPSQLACTEAVVLILGGKGAEWNSGKVGETRAEVYSPDGHLALSGFKSGSWGQALFYHEGRVVLCGGCSGATVTSCLVGEYQKDAKGPTPITFFKLLLCLWFQ